MEIFKLYGEAFRGAYFWRMGEKFVLQFESSIHVRGSEKSIRSSLPAARLRLPQKILSAMMNESTTFRYSFSLSLRPWSVMSKDFVLILCFTSLRVSVTVVVLLPRQVK